MSSICPCGCGYACEDCDPEIESLRAKLDIAVKALQYIANYDPETTTFYEFHNVEGGITINATTVVQTLEELGYKVGLEAGKK